MLKIILKPIQTTFELNETLTELKEMDTVYLWLGLH